MRAPCVVLLGLLFVPLALWSCGDSSDGGNTNVNDNSNEPVVETGTITGVVSLLAKEARSSVAEVEPNDTFEQATSTITVSAGTRLEIFGDLSTAGGDLSDAFLFQVESAAGLQMQAILSFDFNPQDPTQNNLAIGLSDLTSGSCGFDIGGPLFTECVDTERNPEVATFQVSGSFGLAIQALAGEASYVLGLEFSAQDAALPTGAGVRKISGAIEINGTLRRLPGDGFVPSELLVKFDQGLSKAKRRSLLEGSGLEVLQKSPSGVYRCRKAAPKNGRAAQAVDTIRMVQALQNVPGIRIVEPNYRYFPAREPNDEFFALQWNHPLINLPDAWDITTGDPSVIIAVVDTGILGDHPDISARLIPGYDFISDPASARDGDGIDSDPTDEGDLSGGPGASSFHGTHVTGVLGAVSDNGVDIAGVTWGCPIMPVRALGVGGGSSFDIGEAVRYAAGIANVSGVVPETPATVINMSIATTAGSPPSSLMGNAISEAVAKGIVVVVAAGNDGSSLPAYPAAFPDSISVAACDPQLELAPYSNFGTTIDFGAPGGNLALDLTGDGYGDGVLSLMGIETAAGIEHSLSFQHGTSMACPHVAGVVALMKSENPDLSVAEVREILADTAIDVGAEGPDLKFGAGVINAAGAVSEAARRAGQETTPEPKIGLSTTGLNFSFTIDELTVQVTNTGGGTLEVISATVEEFVGTGWLQATLQGGSGSTNVSGIVATVDRTGLADGTYVARITVSGTSVAGAFIDVEMQVGASSPSEETIFVVVIDSETRITIAQDVTSAARGFAFEIADLPPKSYKIYAGTDRDGDDQICDLGELCGGFPSAIAANEVTVEAGVTITTVNFAVGDIIFEPQSAQRVTTRPIQLLN
ncbi:MAG: S8 family peptidase [Planctomycetes bacterium]|nr:S8 family peptidase [Planctomycetota bacterium]